MSTRKIALPNIPKNADRDTTVFLQSIKKAVEKLSADDIAGINKSIKDYVVRLDNKTRDDLFGTIGNETSIGAILDKIKGQITESELSKHLGSRIEQITSNENAVSEERLQRIADIIAADEALDAEVRARVADTLASTNAIVAERDARIADVLANSNAIAAEAQARADALLVTNQAVIDERRDRIAEIKDKAAALQASIDAEGAERLRRDDLLAQDIVSETTQRQTETGLLTEKFDGIYVQVNPRMSGDINRWAGDDDYFAGVWSLESARIEDGLATSKKFDVVTANINANAATITQVNTALVTKNEVVASQINMLSAQMVGGYDGSDLNQLTSGLIYQERIARATEFEGLAEQISLLSAGVGEQFDPFEIWHFNDDKDGWTGGIYDAGFINVSNDVLASPAIDINGNMYRHIKMRIKKVGSPTWAAKVTYGATEQTEQEPDFDLDGIATISIRMEWSGAINGFTLQLASVASTTNYYAIDWIAVGRLSPGASSAALLNEQRVRSSADSALSESIITLDSKVDTKTASLSSTITEGLSTLTTATGTNATKISNLTSRVDTDLGAIIADINSNYQAQADENAATATKLDSVIAKAGVNTAAITTEATARANEDGALSSRIDTLVATTGNNTAAISTEVIARTTEDTALSGRIDTLTATTGDNTAAIQTEVTARTTEDTALSGRIDTLVTTTGENTASITQEVAARTSQYGALSERVEELVVSSGGNSTVITGKIEGLIEADIAIGRRIDTVVTTVDSNSALITSNENAQADKNSAFAEKLDGVFAQTNPKMAGDTEGWAGDDEYFAGVWSERSATIEQDLATSKRIEGLVSNINDNKAAITQTSETLVNKNEAVAKQVDRLSAQMTGGYDGNDLDFVTSGLIHQERQARATQTEAIAEEVLLLSAVVGENSGAILTEQSVRAGEDEAITERLDLMLATVGTNTAAITTETNARVAEDAAIAGRITTFRSDYDANVAVVRSDIQSIASDTSALSARTDTLQTTVGENTASVQTAQNSIDGINASWSIKTDVNGVVGGLGVVNDGRTVDFILRASSFAIQGPSGSTSVPFVVYPDGEWIGGVWVPGGVYMDTAVIRRGSFDSLSALSANIGHFKSATSGARLEIQDGLLTVYDTQGRLRVKLGVW